MNKMRDFIISGANSNKKQLHFLRLHQLNQVAEQRPTPIIDGPRKSGTAGDIGIDHSFSSNLNPMQNRRFIEEGQRRGNINKDGGILKRKASHREEPMLDQNDQESFESSPKK
jgi:hypothetical protein